MSAQSYYRSKVGSLSLPLVDSTLNDPRILYSASHILKSLVQRISIQLSLSWFGSGQVSQLTRRLGVIDHRNLAHLKLGSFRPEE